MEANGSSTPPVRVTDMRRGTLVITVLLAAAAFAFVRLRAPAPAPPNQSPQAASLDHSPVCPWRDPIRDLKALFPPATNFVLESHIVSRSTAEIVKRLGRQMSVDENPLRVFRVQNRGDAPGSILVCRVKGTHGGIELVTGVELNGRVRGVVIQSQREPEAAADVITNPAWLGSFGGKTAQSPLRIGEDLPEVPSRARESAQAIADGVRSQLIVLSFAEKLESSQADRQTHH